MIHAGSAPFGISFHAVIALLSSAHSLLGPPFGAGHTGDPTNRALNDALLVLDHRSRSSRLVLGGLDLVVGSSGFLNLCRLALNLCGLAGRRSGVGSRSQLIDIIEFLRSSFMLRLRCTLGLGLRLRCSLRLRLRLINRAFRVVIGNLDRFGIRLGSNMLGAASGT